MRIDANIRVTKEELKRAGRTSVELEDESGGFWEPWVRLFAVLVLGRPSLTI
jgi:hypothetical protein